MERNSYIMIPYCPCKHESKRTLNIMHWIKHRTLKGHLCWISFPLVIAVSHLHQSRTITMFCLKQMRKPMKHIPNVVHENKWTLYALQSRLHHPIILQFFRMHSQRKQNIHLDLKRPHTIANNLQAILKDSKQNSHKSAQGAYRCTYLHNHVNEDQSQTAKKMIQVGTGITSSLFREGK